MMIETLTLCILHKLLTHKSPHVIQNAVVVNAKFATETRGQSSSKLRVLPKPPLSPPNHFLLPPNPGRAFETLRTKLGLSRAASQTLRRGHLPKPTAGSRNMTLRRGLCYCMTARRKEESERQNNKKYRDPPYAPRSKCKRPTPCPMRCRLVSHDVVFVTVFPYLL
ncbi:hypothetical protein LZ31DRAFT_27510 [Colletotrichum somersetense]|nr:hypothetical protein LZ31DRAFT_27510 [Colletotrichum somersetense]